MMEDFGAIPEITVRAFHEKLATCQVVLLIQARRRLARFAASRRARQHRAPAASTLRAGAELDREHLGVSAQQLAQPLRLGHL